MAQSFGVQQTQGTATANNAGATVVIVAGQAGKILRITHGTVSVTTPGVGGGALARLCDGTTTIMQWDGNAAGAAGFNYGESGYPLSVGNSLQLIVSGAITTQATATCAAVVLVC